MVIKITWLIFDRVQFMLIDVVLLFKVNKKRLKEVGQKRGNLC